MKYRKIALKRTTKDQLKELFEQALIEGRLKRIESEKMKATREIFMSAKKGRSSSTWYCLDDDAHYIEKPVIDYLRKEGFKVKKNPESTSEDSVCSSYDIDLSEFMS